ncbi:hypothetical protein MKY51_13520 [Solibacillus sp. FSL R5-0691]|uniref:hypothetical protein n=1 Tax=Solibacillus sp. FSL R5-0691 TaxID=2921653 RepID=UPI0030CEAD99
MTNSRVKQAIDETIGREPLMDEAFVQKILDGKQHRKKRLPFMQPAIVLLILFAVCGMLYFMPQSDKQLAVDIEEQYLTDEEEQLVKNYYSAILNKNKKSLEELTSIPFDQAVERYSKFDLKQPLQVLKKIDSKEFVIVYVKLHSNGTDFLDRIELIDSTGKVDLDVEQPLFQYESDITLPKFITLDYKVAPTAPLMQNVDFDKEKVHTRQLNGYTLYLVPRKGGVQHVLEIDDGQYIDLNITSDMTVYTIAGNKDTTYFVNDETKEATFLFRNKFGDYQMITGQVQDGGGSTYNTDFHENPVALFVGDKPKIITIDQGQLMYADVFEYVKFVNPNEFYSTESAGPNLLVKYTDDYQQVSTYYEFIAIDELQDSRTVNMYETKPEHLKDVMVQNRYKYNIQYVFDNGTLHYKDDTRIYIEKPKSKDEKPYSGELIEKTYTNIQIETKGNQYFITGDNGFSWTLTRTAPRILVDEKGIEYTIPIAFEDIPKTSDILLEDEIQSLGIYKIGGLGTYAYTLDEDLEEVNELFNQATVNEESIRLGIPEYMIDIEYENGNRESLELMFSESNDASYVKKHDIVNNTLTLFKIPKALADHFSHLAEKIKEINKAK